MLDYEALRSINIFKDLTTDEVESIAPLLRVQSYKNHEQVITLGDMSREVFFILSGKIRITTFTSVGKEVAFQDMQAGQMFGELSAIDGLKRSTNAVAISNAKLIVVSANNFFKILTQCPSVNMHVLYSLTGLIRKLGNRVVEFSAYSVTNRIHAELLRLAAKHGISNNVAEIIPVPKHSDISNRISTHREAVSREVSILTKKEILKRTDGKLVILDVKKLQGMLAGLSDITTQ